MNSFNTDEDTEKILRKYAQMKIKIHTFNQSRFVYMAGHSSLTSKDLTINIL